MTPATHKNNIKVGSRILESDSKTVSFSQDPNHLVSGARIVIAHQTKLNASHP
jgi:hypothetical protein